MTAQKIKNKTKGILLILIGTITILLVGTGTICFWDYILTFGAASSMTLLSAALLWLGVECINTGIGIVRDK
jgi:flagellar basal body-associated protein FliL